MPCVASDAGARILQRLELQTLRSNADHGTVPEQKRLICRDEVGERPPFPDVPVKPEPTVHRVDHPIAPLFEFSKLRSFARALWRHGTFRLLAGHHPGDGRRRDGRCVTNEERAEVRI